jgi:cob(I)alamin adenosyltransferase
MVRITRVYTGGGDKGQTSLVDGSRRMKSDPRFETVGTCDELNSILGCVLMEVKRMPSHDDGGDRTNVQRVELVVVEALGRIQHELFDLGAELACPPEDVPEYMTLIGKEQSELLVEEMDAWLEDLEPLTSFILPTGSPPVATMHVGRCIARRLERSMVQLLESEGKDAIRPTALVYINRLSDWLFVMGRWVSEMLGEDETLWLPLGKRPSERGVADRVNKMRSNDDDFSDL